MNPSCKQAHYQPGKSFLRPSQMRSLAQDFRRSPGVAVVETPMLMLGISATSAIVRDVPFGRFTLTSVEMKR